MKQVAEVKDIHHFVKVYIIKKKTREFLSKKLKETRRSNEKLFSDGKIMNGKNLSRHLDLQAKMRNMDNSLLLLRSDVSELEGRIKTILVCENQRFFLKSCIDLVRDNGKEVSDMNGVVDRIVKKMSDIAESRDLIFKKFFDKSNVDAMEIPHLEILMEKKYNAK